jgi:F-type H+-transporting ATPase subunit epsilon
MIESTQKTIHVRIVSQEEEVFSGDALMVFCRSEGGDLGIYPNHSPLLSLIRPGVVRIKLSPELKKNASAENPGSPNSLNNPNNPNSPKLSEELVLYVSGGILEVQPSIVLILADVIERPQDVDQFEAEEAIAAARAILSSPSSGSSGSSNLSDSSDSAVSYYQAYQNIAEASAKLRVLGLAKSKSFRED